MIKIKHGCIFLIVCMIVACQGNISDNNLTPEAFVSPKETNLTVTNKTIVPIIITPDATKPNIITPDEGGAFEEIKSPGETISMDTNETPTHRTPMPVVTTPLDMLNKINSITEFQGRLFLGGYDGKKYIEINFENGQAISYEMPTYCQFLSNGQKAICIQNFLTDNEVTYIYDVISKEEEFPFEEEGGRWHLTSSENLLVYILNTGQKDGVSIYAYDFGSKESLYVGDYEDQGYLYPPQLSNSGNLLIGLDYQTPQLEDDDHWYIMHAESMIAEPLKIPENIVATESLAWAPNDASVALIGYYREDGSGASAGTLVCGRVALIYDPITQSTIHMVKMPEMRCITPLSMYSFYSDKYYWSPDSSKLALVLDQQDICIIDLSTKLSTCSLITNYYGTEIRFRGLAWSPDSKYLAFIFSDNNIQVFSLKDGRTYNLANTKELSPFRIGDILVWGQ